MLGGARRMLGQRDGVWSKVFRCAAWPTLCRVVHAASRGTGGEANKGYRYPAQSNSSARQPLRQLFCS